MAVSHSLRKGVMRLDDGRWTKVLRFVMCVIITALLLILTSPNVC